MCKQKRKTRLQVPRPNGNQPLVQLGNSVYYIVMGEKKVYALISHSPNRVLFFLLSIEVN